MSTLDIFVPQRIKALHKNEELNRARTLVFLILAHMLASIILGALFHTLHYRAGFSQNVQPLSLVGISGQLLALLTFWFTARHALAGNIFALTFYITTFFTALSLSGQALFGIILYLFALPLVATFVANFVSGVVWIILVALTPFLLRSIGHANIEAVFIINWVASCPGLFVVIYVIYSYIKHLSARLNYQCSLLEFSAAHDALTGLANRTVYESRLNESIELCKLHGTQSTLVYIDLDRFKPINDSYGHHTGDIVLTTVADRLRHLVRSSDLVVRLGGDEFAIIFDQCNPDGIRTLINRLPTVVGDPIIVSGNSLSVGCSIGVVICPDDGLDATQLTRVADERMYVAKRSAADAGKSKL